MIADYDRAEEPLWFFGDEPVPEHRSVTSRARRTGRSPTSGSWSGRGLIPSTPHGLDELQLSRAAGVLLATICADHLNHRRDPGETSHSAGVPSPYGSVGQIATRIAQIAAAGADLLSRPVLNEIARAAEAARGHAVPGTAALASAAIVALACLHDPERLTRTARAVAAAVEDPGGLAGGLASDACVLWGHAIRAAVVHGTLDGLHRGLDQLPQQRCDQWLTWISDTGLADSPASVVAALQAAWSAVIHTPIPVQVPAAGQFNADHLPMALRSVTGSQAASAAAGALLGAYWGVPAIPLQWQQKLPAADLVRLAVLTASGGKTDRTGWPLADRQRPPRVKAYLLAHPYDPGVLLGNLPLATSTRPSARLTAGEVDAVVSLCRVGCADFAEHVQSADHVRVWLVDANNVNAHPAFAIDQAARTVARLRRQGKRVLLHCAAGQSRTAIVGARYGVLTGAATPADALDGVLAVIPSRRELVNADLRDALLALGRHR